MLGTPPPTHDNGTIGPTQQDVNELEVMEEGVRVGTSVNEINRALHHSPKV